MSQAPHEHTEHSSERPIFSLELRCIAVLLRNPHKIANMSQLPESSVVLLLRGLAAHWRLTPKLVERFQRSGHPAVLEVLKNMNLNLAAGIYVLVDTPPPRQIGDYTGKDKG